MENQRPMAFAFFAWASSIISVRRAIKPTCHPASRNVRAVCNPIPALAPVIIMVFMARPLVR